MTTDKGAERKVAIVTGGSRGIGRAIVERLARAGLNVTFTFVANQAAARDLEASLAGMDVRGLRIDARDPAACKAMAESVIAQHGHIDVLVNNAAVVADRLLAMMSLDDWDKVLDTSLKGLFGTTQPTAKQMMRQRSGRIVNLTSVSGIMGIAGQTIYSAAKAAIIGLTKSIAKEVATEDICINAVAPAVIRTKILEQLTPAQVDYMVQRIPMKRTGQPEEVAAVVHFLSSRDCSFVTGQCYDVSGGRATY